MGLAACADDGPATESGEESSEETGDASSRFELRPGVVVVVTPTGAATLEVDARDTLTLADVGPIVRRFEERYVGAGGIWEVTRTNPSESRLERFEGASQDESGVTLQWSSSDGNARGRVVFSNHGQADLADAGTVITFTLDEGEADGLALPIRCDAEGSFHGFGGQYNQSDQRGEAFRLMVSEQGIGRDPSVVESGPFFLEGDEHTTYFPMAWYLDVRGFGVLFETPRSVEVDLCASDPELAWFEVTSGEPLRAELYSGPTPAEVVEQLGRKVGRPASPPAWAFMPWIAAQGGRDEVLADLATLESAGIPFGALWVQDWTGIRMNLDGGFGVNYRWLPDEDLYPDLAGLIDIVHQGGHKFLSYANPFVPNNLDHFGPMSDMDLLVEDPNSPGQPYLTTCPSGLCATPDLTNEATRTYIKGFLSDMVEIYGMDGWMADFSEWLPHDGLLSDGSSALDRHNTYPIEWQRLTREVFDELRPDGDWAMFARAGWPGVHAVAQLHWIGDQEADWSSFDGLPTVVPAMTNLGLSGVPITTHDIAGFSGGPSTKELYMRWTELGAFTPIMRTHDGNDKENNWSWERDAETSDHFRRFALIHELLAPELEAFAAEAATSSMPLVRHLMLAFPDDPMVWNISDQYMLGDKLLVAPVTVEGASSRELYLPAGSWFDVWTGEMHEGGQTITVDAPIGSPPVFNLGEDRSDLRAVN